MRERSRAAVAAGFLKARRLFGGPGGTSRIELHPGGDIARGGGKKARDSRLVATFENFANDADKVAAEPVRRAMNHVSGDMLEYAQKKMQKDANKHSAR